MFMHQIQKEMAEVERDQRYRKFRLFQYGGRSELTNVISVAQTVRSID